MKPSRTIVGIIAGTSLVMGGVDASSLKEVPLERVEMVAENRVEAKQIGNIVETTLPWKDQAGLKVKVDLGEPTLAEKVKDKRKKEVITETVTDFDGGFKVDILLTEKPTTNRFCYTIEGAENYDFFYQPPLTEQEKANGSSRPPEIEGSYAVYHKTLKNHVIGQENYATGKVMHIPRPQVWELGNEEATKQWADLSYENGQLCVTAPQDFLDNADYTNGVRIDPTFGYTTIGATSVSWPNGNNSTSQFNLPVGNVVVTKLTTYWAGAGSCGNPVYGDIYSDTGSNAPGALLGVTEGLSTAQVIDGWNDMRFSSPVEIVSSGNYWLGVISASSCAAGRGDSAGNNAFTADTPPPDDPFGAPTSSSFRKSIYATYEFHPTATMYINNGTLKINNGTLDL